MWAFSDVSRRRDGAQEKLSRVDRLNEGVCWLRATFRNGRNLVMVNQESYRILLPDGRLSTDVFHVPVTQPVDIRSHCVLAVNDRDGATLTVHRSRLLPVAIAEPKKVCLTCGRVEGVLRDEVKCPFDEHAPCELIEPHDFAASGGSPGVSG
jgi:hypothetical protein